jgi:hypothetical protein
MRKFSQTLLSCTIMTAKFICQSKRFSSRLLIYRLNFIAVKTQVINLIWAFRFALLGQKSLQIRNTERLYCSLDHRSSISGRGKRLSPLHIVQIGSGAHRASYPVGTWVPFLGVKQPVREAGLSPTYSVLVKNDGAILPPPLHRRGVLHN